MILPDDWEHQHQAFPSIWHVVEYRAWTITARYDREVRESIAALLGARESLGNLGATDKHVFGATLTFVATPDFLR